MKQHYILILLFVLFISSCSSIRPVQESTQIMGKKLHEGMMTGVKDKKIPLVLDIVASNTREQTTGRRLPFSSYLENAVVRQMSFLPAEAGSSVAFKSARSKEKSIETVVTKALTESEAIKKVITLGGNILLTGNYVQITKDAIQVHLKLVDTSDRLVVAAVSTKIDASTIPTEIFRTFPLQVKKTLVKLKKDLKQANLFEFPGLVTEQWNPGFTPAQMTDLKSVITQLILEKINSLTDGVHTLADIKKLRKAISELGGSSLNFRELDYKYIFTTGDKKKLKQGKRRLAGYEQVIKNGLQVKLAFVANSRRNSIDFECDAIFDHDLVMYVNDAKYHYDYGRCSVIGKKHMMIWGSPTIFKTNEYRIRAVEEGLWDTTFDGLADIALEDLLKVYNKGAFTKPFEDSDYSLRIERYKKKKKSDPSFFDKVKSLF